MISRYAGSCGVRPGGRARVAATIALILLAGAVVMMVWCVGEEVSRHGVEGCGCARDHPPFPALRRLVRWLHVGLAARGTHTNRTHTAGGDSVSCWLAVCGVVVLVDSS